MPATLSMSREVCPVVAITRPAARYVLATLRAPYIAKTFRPGQFVMAHGFDGADPLLPRPLAICDADPVAGTIRLLLMPVGRGTKLLCDESRNLHSNWRLLGPLGRGFWPFPATTHAICVAGGTGAAALISWAQECARKPGLTPILLIGARDKSGILEDAFFTNQPTQYRVERSTDNGELGFHGTVVGLLEKVLRELPRGSQPALYVAGPDRMMRAVAAVAADRDLPCQVSLEERMACGVGICRACVVNGCTPHAETGLKRRAVCCDGPVFSREELEAYR
ncbi:MAG TPA: dihydroorotate dehydrogenase electron transfer subunit [Planctomycetota bacterium]|nr:dihydroorotate dehydrogenase electron transfer subunit [Planctomycetota bacterium]